MVWDMRTVQRQKVNEAFWQRKSSVGKSKKLYDPYFVCDGSYRWFQSSNVVRLEDYRDAVEMERIRTSILKPAKVRARYCVA